MTTKKKLLFWSGLGAVMGPVIAINRAKYGWSNWSY